MFEYRDIRRVHLELSSRCNASCPECPRNLRGGDIESHNDFDIRDMSLQEAQQIFTPEFLQQLDAININGNYGDFITCRDGLKIVEYFAKTNPNLEIDISTNGSGQPKIWEPLAKIPQLKEVWFRLDGLNDTHHLYRQYTDFDLIIRNAKKYIDAGGKAVWAMIKFDFNEHQIETARQMSKDLGFARFELIDVGRSNSVVFKRDGTYSHTIGQPDPEIRDYQVLLDMRKYVKNRPSHAEYYETVVPAKAIQCKALTPPSIYIQSDGKVYPCCWTGFYPDTNQVSPGAEQTRALSQGKNNALEVGIEQAISWFKDLAQTWAKENVLAGRHYKCNSICGVSD